MDHASNLCMVVEQNPAMSNATARFGAWLIGAAAKSGGFPLELTFRQIRDGFERNGHEVNGMGGRYETIRASIEWYEEQGLLLVRDGRPSAFGFMTRIYNFT